MEPIAIIGIGCRFPGADGPEAFWQLLRDGVDAIAEVPADRWDLRTFYDPDPAAPGKMNTRWGGFLEHVDQFDPQAFWIAPREAARIDPQQRLLLEVAWEALEDAGQPIDRLGGTATGVFIGISTNDYSWSQFGDPDQIDAYANTGNALSIAANRISFVFDLRGPSLAVDTACSSSLVAVHLACQSLWRGEATLALAGGVNLILAPEPTIGASKLGAMAPDGRCKTFDARANGYVRGEGAGIVVLKALANALADGDPIYAAILGSAIGQDGRTNGLTAPSRQAQEAVLRAAYQQAGVSPGRVQYVEAHGTGTLLGDPIEAKALGAVLAGDGPPAQRCATGSVKTNIGHLEAAAGVAGLIKVALSLKHRAVPPSLHFQQPNPHIPFDQLGLRVQQALEPWPAAPWPALAGVSSFGFGGTNAHVVLQEAPDSIGAASDVAATASGQAYLLPLSAHSPQALTALARAYHDLLADEPRTEEPRTENHPEGTRPQGQPRTTDHGLRATNYELRTTDNGLRTTGNDQNLHDLCYTASVRRSHHDHRIAIVGRSRAEVATQLAAAVRGEARPGVAIGQRSLNRRRKLVFVFSGQGGQWPGMGRELLEQEPAFRAALERCDNALSRYVDWSVVDVLAGTDGPARFEDIEVIQPTLFAFQVALAALWRSWGVRPDAVIGHSMGEVAAAHVAGALALEDAARVIARRSQLLARLRGQGGMALLELPLAQAQQALAPFAGQLAIAASNSNTATVVAGAPDALEELMAELRRENIFCRQVQVDVAAHSPQVEPLQSELVQMLEGLQAGAATTPIYSTVSGARLDGRAFEAVYWSRNLREPVQFAAAVQQALADGHELFLEISPHPVLASALQQGLQARGQKGQALASMRRDQAERAGLLATLGALYTLGQSLDWGALYPRGGQSVGLPAYPWQRSRHWLERQVTEDGAVRRGSSAGQIGFEGHPFVGQYIRSAAHPGTHFWEIELSTDRFPYLADHRVEGVVAVPAALTVELVLAAAASAFGPGSHALEQVAFTHMLILPEGKPQIVQLIVTRDPAGTAAFEIYSRPAEPPAPSVAWTRHAQGSIRLNCSTNVQSHDTGEVQARCLEVIDGAAFYAVMHAHGLEYGPGFQGLVQVWRRDGEALGRLHLPATLAEDRAAYHMHPALLDSGFQLLAAAVASTHPREAGCYVPVGLARLCCYAPLRGDLWAHARLHEAPAINMIEGDLVLQDAKGVVVLEALGLRLQRVGQADLPDELPGWLYEIVWRPASPPAPRAAAAPGRWLIFAERGGVGRRLQASLEARGARCVIVSPGEQYRRESPAEYQLTPQEASAFRQQLQTVLTDNPGPWQGVVHLWSLASSPDTLTTAELATAGARGCGSVLQLVQELVQAGGHNQARLWLVTQGVQPVGANDGRIAVTSAPLWGFGRALALEHPQLRCAIVDLSWAADDAEIEALSEILSSDDPADQIALRGSERYVPRLVRYSPAAGGGTDPAGSPPMRADGTYLIAGGLGGLGLTIAGWLVEQGARHLALLARSAPSAAAQTAMEAMRQQGAQVVVAQADLTDAGQLAGALADVERHMPPLRGVVHAAGLLDDCLVASLTAERLATVLAPKVQGAWNLHLQTRGAQLEFFVLFSSVAAVLGAPGQSNYAAANAFLDALAAHRRGQGLPALSINWGPWAEVGLAARPERGGRLAERGLGSFTPAEGAAAFGRLLGHPTAQVVVMKANWQQLVEQFPVLGTQPLLLELVQADGTQIENGRPASERSELVRRLANVHAHERRGLLVAHIQHEVASVLGLDRSQLPEPEQGFFAMGMDSLMAVELIRRLQAGLGSTLPSTLIFEYATIAALADYLAQNVIALEPPETSAQQPQKQADQLDTAIGKLEQLSEDEAAALLLERLARRK